MDYEERKKKLLGKQKRIFEELYKLELGKRIKEGKLSKKNLLKKN